LENGLWRERPQAGAFAWPDYTVATI